MQIAAERTTFTTSREMEFFSEKELTMQIGCGRSRWPLALLKELIDNSLDACEKGGIPPVIHIDLEESAFSVIDNAPGLPVSTIKKSLDYTVRVSDKSYYVSPTRGQMGNALKCVWAAPFVMDGQTGKVEVSTGGQKHTIDVSLDQIARTPHLKMSSEPSEVKIGSKIKMHWPSPASCSRPSKWADFYLDAFDLVDAYRYLNPHAAFSVYDARMNFKHSHDSLGQSWKKWQPNEPTSAWWYGINELTDLIRAEVAEGRSGGRKKTVRQFIAEFAGLTSKAKQKCVFEAAQLPGDNLDDLVCGNDVNLDVVERLRDAMQKESRPIPPESLGALDLSLPLQLAGIEPATSEDRDERKVFRRNLIKQVPYKKITGHAGDLPFVVEAAFCIDTELDDADDGEESVRKIICGVNWSPTLPGTIPFVRLSNLLGEQRIDGHDPVTLIVHIAYPKMRPTDRGKSHYDLPAEINAALTKCVKSVTKQWKKEKLNKEKVSKSERKRMEESLKSGKSQLRQASYDVMEEAYLKVSDNGKYPANARQIMYVARPKVIAATGCFYKDSASFTQGALPDFIAANHELTKDWDVVFDARGHFKEPHTNYKFGLSTLGTREYINSWHGSRDNDDIEPITIEMDYPTRGPENRYKYALFIEKEGFDPLLEHARIDELYDLAIFSTKGMSVTAARRLVEELSKNGVTILVLHDFDFSGLNILHTIRNNTRRYQFKDRPNVIDLGLRLEDVKDLESEPFHFKRREKDPRIALERYGATKEERDFLVTSLCRPWEGNRTELNSMTSPQFIRYLKNKLDAIPGLKKVVPGEETLIKAFKQQFLGKPYTWRLRGAPAATHR
jgi:DNA topoisomerase VI subunit B